MATAVLIPVSEYLKTTYRPDCDYVDGEVRERHVGERPHALVQGIFAALLWNRRRDWKIVVLPEQRLQISDRRYRIPDVCVVRSSDPRDNIVRVAPLLCIEVLSPSDTLSSLQERVDDYVSIGVENIWAIDPVKRVAYYASARGFEQPADGMLHVAGTEISIALAEVFAEFDES